MAEPAAYTTPVATIVLRERLWLIKRNPRRRSLAVAFIAGLLEVV
jgi:hypothetical protein